MNKSTIANVISAIDEKPRRERVLIFASVIAITFLIWNFLIQIPIDNDASIINEQLNTLATQRAGIEVQIATLSMAVAGESIRKQQQTVKTLESDMAKVDETLAGISQGLVSAKDLPKALEDLLLNANSLQLVSLATLPSVELQMDQYEKNEDQKTAVSAGVYKHSVLLIVKGDYMSLIKFLSMVEMSQWRFYWESLDYEVDHYPQATISIRVFTLSSDEGFIGV
jgi:MSHA biogenesis protein MshJ